MSKYEPDNLLPAPRLFVKGPQHIIGQINEGRTDEELTRFIPENDRLVLLTADETTALNRVTTYA
jgi:hypothetical protein